MFGSLKRLFFRISSNYSFREHEIFTFKIQQGYMISVFLFSSSKVDLPSVKKSCIHTERDEQQCGDQRPRNQLHEATFSNGTKNDRQRKVKPILFLSHVIKVIFKCITQHHCHFLSALHVCWI